MCVGRIDLHTCGCFDAVKVFPCADDVNQCGRIRAMITNHINSLCSDCTERKENNVIRLNRMVTESREKGAAQQVTCQDYGTSTLSLTEADAVAMPPTGPLRSLSDSMAEDDAAATVPDNAEQVEKGMQAIDRAFEEIDRVLGADMGQDEVVRPKSRSSKSGKIFLCCFKVNSNIDSNIISGLRATNPVAKSKGLSENGDSWDEPEVNGNCVSEEKSPINDNLFSKDYKYVLGDRRPRYQTQQGSYFRDSNSQRRGR
ncbi:uncharacterized protein RAG0_10026 [Rhynchosporium agropyri]|uniref:Uncharacterized protein n=1 Tax=Rhynchosporium agropyri TaxID=914238 RepID=A0A1E1KY45_9HELO|nr:uncharacterized protein RAG0_10026 [Rhynchosporium agropyri]